MPFKNSIKNNDKENTFSLATNVKLDQKHFDKFKPCSLCSSKNGIAQHPINKCEKYKSAKSKIERIKELTKVERMNKTQKIRIWV